MVGGHTFVLLFWSYIFAASSTTVSSNAGTFKCRVCDNARDLSECTTEATCGQNEDCYMDQVITETFRTVFNGGCRARDVCQQRAGSVVGRRDSVVACSRCCGGSSGCNIHLCGITSPDTSAGQCYFCDVHQPHPSGCSTLTVCQHDEFCYTGEVHTAGSSEFKYGCMKQSVCRILMKTVFAEYDRCYNRHDDINCGGAHNGATSLCHSCCGDGGCNNGTCTETNDRLYQLHSSGLLDPVTLATIRNATSTP